MTEQELTTIRADLATLKPRDRVSILTDEQERLLYDTVPALLGEIDRLQRELTAAKEHNRDLMEAYNGLREQARGYRL